MVEIMTSLSDIIYRSLKWLITVERLAFVADFGTRNIHLKTKFDMENKTSTNHENGNDANGIGLKCRFNALLARVICSVCVRGF